MEVVEKKDENRMSFENLAIVIGPNIMPVESKKTDKAKELEHERKSIDAHTRIVEVSVLILMFPVSLQMFNLTVDDVVLPDINSQWRETLLPS